MARAIGWLVHDWSLSGVLTLQSGAAISARVLQVLDSGQAQIAIGGQTLSVRSEVPLQAGQTLQLAVSHGMRADVLRAYPFLDPDAVTVVHNGVDTGIWKPTHDDDTVRRLGVDPTSVQCRLVIALISSKP